MNELTIKIALIVLSSASVAAVLWFGVMANNSRKEFNRRIDANRKAIRELIDSI